MLDYFPNADHAGIYAAEAGKHFEQAGLDVTIRQPADPAAPIKQVAAGRVDLAISYAPEVLRARDEGLAVMSVAALVREPLTSIISLPTPRSARRGPEGQDRGHRRHRLPVRVPAQDPARGGCRSKDREGTQRRLLAHPALLTKRVDATLGGFWNYEGIDLELRGRDPHIIKVDDAGVPPYDELVMVANEDALERDGERIRAFIGALARGTEDLEKIRTRDRGVARSQSRARPRAAAGGGRGHAAAVPAPRGKPFGYQDEQRWQVFTAWMRENRLVTELPDAGGVFTNRYLPGAGRKAASAGGSSYNQGMTTRTPPAPAATTIAVPRHRGGGRRMRWRWKAAAAPRRPRRC